MCQKPKVVLLRKKQDDVLWKIGSVSFIVDNTACEKSFPGNPSVAHYQCPVMCNLCTLCEASPRM